MTAMFLHTTARVTDPREAAPSTRRSGSFEREMDIVRDGRRRRRTTSFAGAITVRCSELTYNHDGRTYDLGTGYGHIAIGVPDLDATLANLAGQGIEPSAAVHGQRRRLRICFVRDPDGYRIELIERT